MKWVLVLVVFGNGDAMTSQKIEGYHSEKECISTGEKVIVTYKRKWTAVEFACAPMQGEQKQ